MKKTRSESPVVKRSLRISTQKPIYNERRIARNLNQRKVDKDSPSVASSRPTRKKTSPAVNANSPTVAAAPVENTARELELEKIYSQKSEQLSFILGEINEKISSQDTQPKVN